MFRKTDDIFRWIAAAEADFSAIRGEYHRNREYYENYQAPEDVPKEISYIVRNLIWDYVNRQVAKIVGGKIEPLLFGDERADVVKELIFDILEENQFQEQLLEEMANYFMVEGIAGLKVVFDPFERGKYGLGMPRIYVLRPEELRLDPNSGNGFHVDDMARAHVKAIPVEEAKERWPEFENQIGQYSDSFLLGVNRTEEFAELWEIEFRKSFLVPHYLDPITGEYVAYQIFDEEQNLYVTPEGIEIPEDAVRIRVEKYFVCKVLNRNLIVEKPRLSGFDGFSIIPVINIPRRTKTKYPASPVFLLRDRQDSINVTESIILEVMKKSPKNPVFVVGARESEISVMKRKFSGVGEVISVQNPEAKVVHVGSPAIPTHIAQKLQIDLDAFDQIGNTSAPDRGEPVELSGKAILALQSRADTPLFVPKVHIESALTQMIRRLVEVFDRRMRFPFSIIREIDGESKEIRFNETVGFADQIEEDKVNVVQEIEGQRFVNPLMDLKFSKISIDIEMNALAQQNVEMSKALALRDRGALSLIDLHKAIYPKKWQETFENATKENMAQQIVADLMEMGPEIMQQVFQILQISKQTTEQFQKDFQDGRAEQNIQ